MTGTNLFVLPSGSYIVPITFQIVVTAATAPGNVTNDCAVVKTPTLSTLVASTLTTLFAVDAGVPIAVVIHVPPYVLNPYSILLKRALSHHTTSFTISKEHVGCFPLSCFNKPYSFSFVSQCLHLYYGNELPAQLFVSMSNKRLAATFLCSSVRQFERC